MVKKLYKRHKIDGTELLSFNLLDASVSEAANGDREGSVLRKMHVEDNMFRGAPHLLEKYLDLLCPMFIARITSSGRPEILYGGAELKLLKKRYPDLRYPAKHSQAGKPIRVWAREAPTALAKHEVTLGAYHFPSRMSQNREYAIKLRAGDAAAKLVHSSLKAHGITIDVNSGSGRAYANTTRSPMALLHLSQQLGKANFQLLLSAMSKAWPGPDSENPGIEVDALTNAFVRGMSLYLRQTELPVTEAIERIKACEWSAYSIRMSAHEKRRKYDWSLPLAICRQLQEVLEDVTVDAEDADVEWDFEGEHDDD